MTTFSERSKDIARALRKSGVPDNTPGFRKAKNLFGCVIQALGSSTNAKPTNWEFLARISDGRVLLSKINDQSCDDDIRKLRKEDQSNIRRIIRDIRKSGSPLGKRLQHSQLSHHTIDSSRLAGLISKKNAEYIAILPGHWAHLDVTPNGNVVLKNDQTKALDLSVLKRIRVLKVLTK